MAFNGDDESTDMEADGFLDRASGPRSHFPGQYWVVNLKQRVRLFSFWIHGLEMVPKS